MRRRCPSSLLQLGDYAPGRPRYSPSSGPTLNVALLGQRISRAMAELVSFDGLRYDSAGRFQPVWDAYSYENYVYLGRDAFPPCITQVFLLVQCQLFPCGNGYLYSWLNVLAQRFSAGFHRSLGCAGIHKENFFDCFIFLAALCTTSNCTASRADNTERLLSSSPLQSYSCLVFVLGDDECCVVGG